MPEIDKTQNSKQQILVAAESLFASKGFEGSSVDAVAKQARVNKATIYYYFESKQAILDCIIEEFLHSFTNTAVSMLKSAGMQHVYTTALSFGQGAITINHEAGLALLLRELESWIIDILEFFVSKRNVLRIMVMESMKDNGNAGLLFQLSDLLTSPGTFQDVLSEVGMPHLPVDILVMKFFGGFLPLICYAICADAWETHYAMQKEMLRQGMYTLFKLEITGYFKTMQDAQQKERH